jgi:hypothetical protein
MFIKIVDSMSCFPYANYVFASAMSPEELLVLQIHIQAPMPDEIPPAKIVKAHGTVTTKNDASHTIQIAQIEAREMMQVKCYPD